MGLLQMKRAAGQKIRFDAKARSGLQGGARNMLSEGDALVADFGGNQIPILSFGD